MNFLDKIQKLPEGKKKILLWLIIIILGVFLLKFYIADVKKNIKAIEIEKIKQQFQPEEIENELKIFQTEKLKQLEKELKKYEGK